MTEVLSLKNTGPEQSEGEGWEADGACGLPHAPCLNHTGQNLREVGSQKEELI